MTGEAFDIQGAKNGLIALVQTIPNLFDVGDGAPENARDSISAWVTIGDPVEIVADRAGGIYKLEWHLILTLGYIVAGQEETAEDQLAAGLTEIVRRVIQNRVGTVTGNSISVSRMLNGTVKTMGLPMPAAMPADYLIMAGQEIRAFPLALSFTQMEAIAAP